MIYSYDLNKLNDQDFLLWFILRYFKNEYIPIYAWNRLNTMLYKSAK